MSEKGELRKELIGEYNEDPRHFEDRLTEFIDEVETEILSAGLDDLDDAIIKLQDLKDRLDLLDEGILSDFGSIISSLEQIQGSSQPLKDLAYRLY